MEEPWHPRVLTIRSACGTQPAAEPSALCTAIEISYAVLHGVEMERSWHRPVTTGRFGCGTQSQVYCCAPYKIRAICLGSPGAQMEGPLHPRVIRRSGSGMLPPGYTSAPSRDIPLMSAALHGARMGRPWHPSETAQSDYGLARSMACSIKRGATFDSLRLRGRIVNAISDLTLARLSGDSPCQIHSGLFSCLSFMTCRLSRASDA